MKILYDKNTYVVTLNTEDENPSTCTYEVTCKNPSLITITQDPVELNKFTVTVGELPTEDNVFDIFEFKVTDEDNNENIIKQYVTIEHSIQNDSRYYNKILAGDTFVRKVDYEDEDVLEKIKNVDGHLSGLGAKTIKGYEPSDNNDSGYLPLSNPVGKFSIAWVYYNPNIMEIEWDVETHEVDSTYLLTITAVDPQSQALIYELTCNDDDVTIVQDTDVTKFHVTYPSATSNLIVRFYIRVTNSSGLSDFLIIRKVIFKDLGILPPIIHDITWDDYNHRDNNSYTMNINASDPQGQFLTYDVECDNVNVSIVQDGTNDNIFHVTYPDFVNDEVVTYTISVTNASSLVTSDTDIRTVLDIPLSGDRGVICGGNVLNYYVNIVDYIDISNLGNAIDFGDLSAIKWGTAACSNGINDRGIIGGGTYKYLTNPDVFFNTIDYITISTPGDATDFGDLTLARNGLAATSNGINDRSIFGGGSPDNITSIDTIDYITISTLGDAIDFGDLSEARNGLASCSNGTNDRGVFGGGGSFSNIIDYITISTPGNATDFGDLTVARVSLAACSNGINDRGIFGGGFTTFSAIDYITISTPGNATDFGDLYTPRYSLSSTSNGINDRGVFAGGYNTSYIAVIDYITISTPGNAAFFGYTNHARTGTSACSDG